MADNSNNLEFKITTAADVSGAQQTAAALDKLKQNAAGATQSTTGLATAIPDLNAKSKDFVITTESQYAAVKKAHDALAANIVIRQAAGLATDVQATRLAALSAALSTDSALNVASEIENKAVAAARTTAAASADVDSAATLEHAAATNVDTIAMREAVVIARELAAGRTSRIPGSVSILLGRFNLLKYVFTAAGAAIAAVAFGAYETYQHLKKVNEEMDTLNSLNQKIASIADNWQAKVKESFQKSTEAAFDFHLQMQNIGADLDPIKTKTADYIQLLGEEATAANQVAEAHQKLAEAKIDNAVATGAITPARAVVLKLDLDEAALEAKLKAAEKKAQAVLDAIREENKDQTANAPKLESAYDAKAKISANAEAAQVELEGKIATNKSRLDKTNAELNDVKFKAQYEKVASELPEKIKLIAANLGSTDLESPVFKEMALGSFSLDDQQAYSQFLEYQNSAKKLQGLIKTQEGNLPAVIEAAKKAEEEAKIAGDAWEDCLKDVAATAVKIKQQIVQNGLQKRTDADVISTSRQTTGIQETDEFLRGGNKTDFANRLFQADGQLPSNEHFASAEAAQTAIENFFTNQTDPYTRIFQAIHGSIEKGNSKINSLTEFWTGKFENLQNQVQRNANNSNLH